MKNATTSTIKSEYSPKQIFPDTKRIITWNGSFWKGVETEDFIYFCNYQEGDDNGSVKMYRKDGLELVSDNYFAHCDLVGVILEKKYTYLSKSMKYNARHMQKENEHSKEIGAIYHEF